MNINEAKQIRLVEYLRITGHHPVNIRGYQYWYLSPLREERTPSFKVNDNLNEWYDFGLSAGGDIIELGKYLYKTSNVSTVLLRISENAIGVPGQQLQSRTVRPCPVEDEMENVEVVDLNHYALLSYLRSRGINEEVGRTYCKEIHYELRKRHYFAIAFENIKGGYEVRNPYYKGCIKGKDISVIRYNRDVIQRHVCVFEGFVDFLSYLMWSLADEKKNEERYKNVPLVIMPEYREAYLNSLEQKQNKGSEESASTEIAKQEVQNTTEQAVTQQIEESEMSGQSHSEAITQEEQGQQTVQSDTRTNENGWNGLFSSLGLNGMGDIGRNLGYVLSMLPDILVGMFTGRTKSLDIGDNIVPMASVLAGLFVKNPVLKMLMIGLGGANLLNKAGHEAIDWKRNEGNSRPVSENRPVQYRSYPDEPLNPRISNPILKGNNLIATIDRVPCTIQLPEKVTAAYHAGALPLNTLANAILAKSDQTRAMMERNFENGERETIIRTRGIQ